MATLKLSDLRGARNALGKSQSEMACLLGISTRSIQSYEQGWREVPSYVQKLVGVMLFLKWRGGQRSVEPCWKVRPCDPQKRKLCPVHHGKAGEFCWMTCGDLCFGREGSDAPWLRKIGQCQKCPAMTRFLAV
jgi:hypothetical protein